MPLTATNTKLHVAAYRTRRKSHLLAQILFTQ